MDTVDFEVSSLQPMYSMYVAWCVRQCVNPCVSQCVNPCFVFPKKSVFDRVSDATRTKEASVIHISRTQYEMCVYGVAGHYVHYSNTLMHTHICRQSYSDTFLAHFLSFSATPTYHTLPQKIQDGMPLFHLPPNQAKPVQPSHLAQLLPFEIQILFRFQLLVFPHPAISTYSIF